MKHLSFKIFYYFSLYCLLLGCNYPTIHKVNEVKIDSIAIKDSSTLKSLKDSLGLMFDNRKAFEILSSKVEPVYTTFFEDSLECKGWDLSRQILTRIINNSRPISGTEQDLAFANHSCGIYAKLRQGYQYYEIEINAGSWMYIKCRDTTLLFGDFNRADEKYFLSGPNHE